MLAAGYSFDSLMLRYQVLRDACWRVACWPDAGDTRGLTGRHGDARGFPAPWSGCLPGARATLHACLGLAGSGLDHNILLCAERRALLLIFPLHQGPGLAGSGPERAPPQCRVTSFNASPHALQGLDWRDPALRERLCNGGMNPLQPGFNDGQSVDPLEVMFVKV